PAAIDFMGSVLPDGWPALRARNRALALAGRAALCAALDVPPPAPEAMIGSLAAVPVADGPPTPPASALYSDPLQDALRDRHGIEVPIVPWPAPPKRLLRISAQLYNEAADYERLAAAVAGLASSEHR